MPTPRAMTQWGRWALVVLVGLLITWTGTPPGVEAQVEGTISGRLTNATTPSTPPSAVEVVLHRYRAETHEADQAGRTDAEGRFRFDALEVSDGLTYQVTAAYGGVPYGTNAIPLTPETAQREIDITVYESTAVDPGLRGVSALLVFSPIDADQQEISTVELITLGNASDRVFAPRPDGPAGPMGLVRFGLPEGARDLRPTLGLDSTQIIQVDRGFASLAPIRPGGQEFGYLYRFPYQGGRYTFEKSLTYGVNLFRVLVPANGPSLVSPQLEAADSLDIDGTTFRAWVGRDLPPGSRISLTLEGLPGRPLWRTLLDSTPVLLPAALALALLCGATLLLHHQSWATAISRDPVPPQTSQELLYALADLDEAFQADEVAEPLYWQQRALVKERLRELAADEEVPFLIVDNSQRALPSQPPS